MNYIPILVLFFQIVKLIEYATINEGPIISAKEIVDKAGAPETFTKAMPFIIIVVIPVV
jgi:hypothetical protein